LTGREAIEIRKGQGTNCRNTIILYELAPHYTIAMTWVTIDIAGTTTGTSVFHSSFYNLQNSR